MKTSILYCALGFGLALSACSSSDDEIFELPAVVTESGACKVVYEPSQWDGGFTANVTVTNKGTAVDGWTLSWSYPSGQKVTTIWNATMKQTGADVTVSPQSWNRGLAAAGTVNFGLNGSFKGSNATPPEFKLNGKSCSGGAAGGGGTGGGTGGGGGGTGGGGTGGGGTGGGGTGGGTGNTCPTATEWQGGRAYKTGDIVHYAKDGNYYIAEHENPGFDPLISTWYWDPKSCGGGGTGGGGTGGGGTGGGGTGGGGTGGGSTGFASIISESQFNAMFPSRNGFYTYAGLVAATASFSGFAASGDTTTRKREVAAFLANVGHETGDLVFIEEINKADYCQPSAQFPCTPGKRYFGRGPIQISWNFNYAVAGEALKLNLLGDPDLVTRSSTVAWQTGLWFWNTQTGAGSITPHNAIVQGKGFGETIRSINGALECGGRNAAQVKARVDRYLKFTQVLGVSAGDNTGC